MKKIIVCGGDTRNYYLCLTLIEYGYDVKWIYAENFPSDENFIKKDAGNDFAVDAVILPLPLSHNNINLNSPFGFEKHSLSETEKILENHTVFTSDDRISGINYFTDEALTVDNARLTAVGFLKELLNYEKEDIMGKSALVTGFGRVSKAVCHILDSNGVNVTVAARNEGQRHTARSLGYCAVKPSDMKNITKTYNYIINTVPAKMLSDDFIARSSKNSVFFELASGMCDKSKSKLNAYIDCKGMPGKHTPKSAGKAIADFVRKKLEE